MSVTVSIAKPSSTPGHHYSASLPPAQASVGAGDDEPATNRWIENILITGGWAHPFEQAGPAVVELLAEEGVRTSVAEDLGVAAALVSRGCELLTVNACRFRMLSDRYTAAQRSAFAAEASPELRAAIMAHVAAGRPILALHTAPICFDEWPTWGEVLGGRWVQGVSHHPPVGEVHVRPVGDHPVVAGLAPFTVIDERYTALEISDGAHIVAVAEGDDGEHPLCWLHQHGNARVAVDLLGHDTRSYEQPSHRALVLRVMRWLRDGDQAVLSAD